MAIDRSKPLSEITFHCKQLTCCRSFKAEPGRVVGAPEHDHHPFQYFANCPSCGTECEQVHWERNLLRAYSKSTGPKTEEGRAASAANLEGHPTPEEALRTRFNAMKHGLSARTATYYPAKPDGYAFCLNCDVDRTFCKTQPACSKQTELFMLHHAAFEQRNPKHLMGIYADLQASIFAVVQQIVQTIVADGVKVEQVVWDKDEDGQVRVAEYIDEKGQRHILRTNVEAHPLFRPLGELLSRAGLTLADMGMTQKVIETEEDQMGRLASETASQEEADAYRKRNMELLSAMAERVQRANKQTESDPILLDYHKEGGAA
ncbi:MAG TPA: hypothetical protein VK149_03420 [Sideroxyarcus sp.]|nr:hypothetical protein [Sideroxyarcus sp.]